MTHRFSPEPPIVIGLTGGIASGKSAVAALFASEGLELVDADRIAREVASVPEVLERIRGRFGAAVVSPDGSLDRAALGELVFRDRRAREALEKILHPRIRGRIRDALEVARAAGRSVLLDAPLLVEGGLDQICDVVVFVDAPRERRVERAESRGWDEGELARREAAQSPLAVKKSRATATIQNAGSLAATRTQVRALLSGLVAPGPGPGRA